MCGGELSASAFQPFPQRRGKGRLMLSGLFPEFLDLREVGVKLSPIGKRVATVSAVLTVGSSLDGEGIAWAVGMGKAHGQKNADRGYTLNRSNHQALHGPL